MENPPDQPPPDGQAANGGRAETESRTASAPSTPRTSLRSRLGKAAVNLFVIGVMALLSLHALPAEEGSRRAALQDDTYPLLAAIGLWQIPWNLFAPSPSKSNSFVSAKFYYRDGSMDRWRSPRWDEMSVLQRARYFRHMEYFDSIRKGSRPAAWSALAGYLAETEGRRLKAGELPMQVELGGNWSMFPPPDMGHFERIEVGGLEFRHHRLQSWP